MHGGDRMATSARGTLAWSAQQIDVCSMTQSSIVRQRTEQRWSARCLDCNVICKRVGMLKSQSSRLPSDAMFEGS